MTADAVAKSLQTWPLKGLDKAEAVSRLTTYGRNELQAAKKISVLKLFFSQFKDILIIILIIAAGVSLGLSQVEQGGSPTEGMLILFIVLAIAVVGFLNEYKAEKTVEALKKLVGHTAKVRRGGEVLEITAGELVPGDIVLLGEGDKVPADVRLTDTKHLQANEASLTGESQPVNKQTEIVSGEAVLGDQKNMVFSGTIITTGSAEGIVVATGQKTQIGHIAGLVNDIESEETPMQKKLDKLGRQLGVGILGICLLVFFVILIFDRELMDASMIQRLMLAFTAAVALAVAAIPEGLAFVVRISLALGARRMAAKNALVRRLSAVEALGSTDVICSDKTGTLTKGEMTVREIWQFDQSWEVSGAGYETVGDFSTKGKKTDTSAVKVLLEIGVLCNNAHLKEGGVIGDPTEGALLVSAAKAGLAADKLTASHQRVNEIPFSSERKLMSTLVREAGAYRIAAKGAVEMVLAKCDKILIDGKDVQLTSEHKHQILAANQRMAEGALRVLAFAQKTLQTEPAESAIEKELTFVGLQAMIDPPRKEVVEVVHRVQSEAGMRVIMITGDYIETAKAIAREIGITGEAITGLELDKIEQEEFEKRVEDISIYARVNPEHKLRIVLALKARGHQVAMTGDGVNDAPAIKAADIGIAMGISGTDASKEASDLILLDDQFLTIIAAIEEGRGIFDNVRKFVNYLLSANIAEVLTVLFGVILFQNLVLTAAQLLFINIMTDGLPAVALGSDPAEKNIMRFKPRHFQENILTPRVWVEMVIFGVAMTAVLLAQFNWDIHGGSTPVAAAFTAMVFYEMVRLIDIRTDYHIPWFSNPWLSVAIAGSLGLQLLVLYTPPLAKIFGVGPISAQNWLIIGAGSVGLFVFMKILNPILNRWQPEIRRA